jgi:hypothetical protein
MYADWLEEFGSTEVDAATVEFIRVSCTDSGRVLMPLEAFNWIGIHWKRLVPTLMSKHVGMHLCERREGRVIHIRYVWDSSRDGRYRPIALGFYRGLLERVQVWSSYCARFIEPLLLADQPVFDRRGPGWSPNQQHRRLVGAT